MKWMLRTVLALTLTALGSVQAYADRLQDIISKGVVRIAVSADSPPFGSQGPDGKLVGLDIELADMVAKALNVKLEYVAVPSASRVAYLVTDKADIVISNLGLTAERAKQVLYTAPYVNTVLGVFGPKSLNISSVDQLGSRSLSGTRGAAATGVVLAANPKANVLQFESDSTSATAFLTGQTELLISSTTTVASLSAQNPGKEMDLKITLRASPAHMAVRLGEHDLLAWLNSFIYLNQLSGDLDRLSKKYLGMPMQPLPMLLPSL